MTERTDITLTINGREHVIAVEPRRTLVDAIREDCGQTGTHIGCEHGICGACTVIVDGEPVRSCLMFAVQADGKKIRTVEGLAAGDKLHPMQQAFIAWQQKLRQDGLPPQTAATLKAAGWTEKDIAAMTANAIRAPAGQVVPQTIVGAVMAAAAIRHDDQGDDKQVTAANAELDKLQKGVTRCGSL